ncbi:MAG: LacI family transcriptional regulator [Anaerolineae bacterium]|nr:LacI family transcriptional regulator [Anaerolineae bacterium]
MQEVALAAAVSVATVSRVLNNPEVVNPETRIRVLETIEALGYQPNLIAKRLRTQSLRSYTIALLIPALRPWLGVVERLESHLLEQRHALLLCTTQHDPNRLVRYELMLGQPGRADGILWGLEADIPASWQARELPILTLTPQRLLPGSEVAFLARLAAWLEGFPP